MARYVALLRGINLGGRRVSMDELRRLLEDAGFDGVRTLLQSGNVVLDAAGTAVEVERAVAAALRRGLGFQVGVMVRTRDELAEVIAGDPFAGVASDPSRYQVSFLAAEPERARELERELERSAVEPERVALRGREVYAWHPNGIARSELAKAISERRLGVDVTARNWRTVTRLLELADASPG